MTSLGMNNTPKTTMLESIHEGMDVYDAENNKIGTVDYIQFGDDDPSTPKVEAATARDPNAGDKTFIDDVAEALTSGPDLPEAIRAQLLREGYIKIDSGLLRSDRYAVLSQVSSVSNDRVTLNTRRDELATG
ncbi:hypothetical protein [Aggregatilinea lenta]|uniref:hypothetical protein n=1 Tax=Aggregatilinea lenta TaxID=913108 RepID=UPI000E5A291B|nr:hypothetical protein [Aggregatilinea lenta]